MPPPKRGHDGAPKEIDMSASPYMPMFDTFRKELDEHHDRRERVIKASRDVTAQSKKVIFSLQRARTLSSPLPAKISQEISPRETAITDLYASITTDLTSTNAWRYQRQVSPGIQEHMESLIFSHYLTTQSLLTFPEAQAKLPTGIMLTEEDYVLGIFDAVGEMMRWAITGMALAGRIPTSEKDGIKRDMVTDLRELRMWLEQLKTKGSGMDRNVNTKMKVMQECVEKVERAVYGMVVRGSERPKGWIPDTEEQREAVETY